MTANRYTLRGLRKHTRQIRADSSPISEAHQADLDKSIRAFNTFFADLDLQADNLRKNVRKLLAATFFNYWYSALLLVESGLTVAAILCERNALEALAFHWLVYLDPVAAEDYSDADMPKPVVVRRRLETLGADIAHIRDGYASGSAISHVGRASEGFHLKWDNEKAGELLIGGAFAREFVEQSLSYLAALLYLFQHPVMVTASDRARGA